MVANLVLGGVSREQEGQVLPEFWGDGPALPADQWEIRLAPHSSCLDQSVELVRVLMRVATPVNVAWELSLLAELHGKGAEKIDIPPAIQDW